MKIKIKCCLLKFLPSKLSIKLVCCTSARHCVKLLIDYEMDTRAKYFLDNKPEENTIKISDWTERMIIPFSRMRNV